MKILVLDKWGGDGGLDWALRAQDAGHQVKHHFTNEPRAQFYGKGLIERVDDWRRWALWADLVLLTDNTKWLAQVEPYRKHGIKIIGATQASAAWELDRNLAMSIFKKHKIDVPPYREFSDYDAAIAYVKREERPFVSKPCGDEPDKALSYVAKSPADLVYMLERWKRASKLKGKFLLQEKVGGIEMAVGGWFGPGGFNDGWCENWEEKKMMPGNLGVATGEMGTTVRYVKKSKLAEKVLKPLEDALAATGHVGYVDVNCIIGEDGTPWPLEFTMRPGWPTFNIQQVLHEGDPAEWLANLYDGRDAHNLAMDTIAVGCVLAIPDFPYSRLTGKEVVGIPIYGLTPKNLHNVHPCQVMQGEAPQDVNGKVVTMPCWTTAGDYVLVASGTGETVQQARRGAYRLLKEIKVPNSPMWRIDIAQRLKKELPELQAMGYATGMEY